GTRRPRRRAPARPRPGGRPAPPAPPPPEPEGIRTMPVSARTRLAVGALLALCAAPLAAQEATPAVLPARYVPLRPPTRREIDRRESLKQFALGPLCLPEDRLIEAVKAFEDAARLDPAAPAVPKALVPLYLALERGGDALASTRKVTELDPSDFEAWLLLARQLKGQGHFDEARTALRRGPACPALKARPDPRQPEHLG